MLIKHKNFKIKDLAILLISSLCLDFFGSWLGAIGWIYQEIDISVLRLLSILTFLANLYIFINLSITVFNDKLNKRRQIPEKTVLYISFVIQCIALIFIHTIILLLSLNML